jgi:hypothetical protein
MPAAAGAVSAWPDSARCLLLLFVIPHQLAHRQDVALHRLFQGGFGRRLQNRQDNVERVQLVEVAMAADRGQGPPYPSLSVVELCRVPAGRSDARDLPASIPVESGGRLYSTQRTQAIRRPPDRASGSSTISARLFVPAGTPDHASGGD